MTSTLISLILSPLAAVLSERHVKHCLVNHFRVRKIFRKYADEHTQSRVQAHYKKMEERRKLPLDFYLNFYYNGLVESVVIISVLNITEIGYNRKTHVYLGFFRMLPNGFGQNARTVAP